MQQGITQIVRKKIHEIVPNDIDLIVVSPLTRCIQTALIIFPPNNSNRNTRIICKEELREAFGVYYPDKRRSISELQNQYPVIEFDTTNNTTNEDVYWRPDKRETFEDVINRIISFFRWLSKTKSNYKKIVIVTHGVWMETAFNYYYPNALRNVNGDIRRVYNCDVYSSILHSFSGNESCYLDNVQLVSNS